MTKRYSRPSTSPSRMGRVGGRDREQLHARVLQQALVDRALAAPRGSRDHDHPARHALPPTRRSAPARAGARCSVLSSTTANGRPARRCTWTRSCWPRAVHLLDEEVEAGAPRRRDLARARLSSWLEVALQARRPPRPTSILSARRASFARQVGRGHELELRRRAARSTRLLAGCLGGAPCTTTGMRLAGCARSACSTACRVLAPGRGLDALALGLAGLGHELLPGPRSRRASRAACRRARRSRPPSTRRRDDARAGCARAGQRDQVVRHPQLRAPCGSRIASRSAWRPRRRSPRARRAGGAHLGVRRHRHRAARELASRTRPSSTRARGRSELGPATACCAPASEAVVDRAQLGADGGDALLLDLRPHRSRSSIGSRDASALGGRGGGRPGCPGLTAAPPAATHAGRRRAAQACDLDLGQRGRAAGPRSSNGVSRPVRFRIDAHAHDLVRRWRARHSPGPRAPIRRSSARPRPRARAAPARQLEAAAQAA